MNTALANKEEEEIEVEEFKDYSELIYRSFISKNEAAHSTFDGYKYNVQEYYLRSLEEYLASGLLRNKEKKLKLMNFITRLKVQHQLYKTNLNKGSKKKTENKVERFGKKMQSSE